MKINFTFIIIESGWSIVSVAGTRVQNLTGFTAQRATILQLGYHFCQDICQFKTCGVKILKQRPSLHLSCRFSLMCISFNPTLGQRGGRVSGGQKTEVEESKQERNGGETGSGDGEGGEGGRKNVENSRFLATWLRRNQLARKLLLLVAFNSKLESCLTKSISLLLSLPTFDYFEDLTNLLFQVFSFTCS